MPPDWNPQKSFQMLIAFGMILCVLAMLGCSHKQVQVPDRPSMPTESLDKGVEIDTFIAACIAEIERREGYEIQLRNALAVCNGVNEK